MAPYPAFEPTMEVYLEQMPRIRKLLKNFVTRRYISYRRMCRGHVKLVIIWSSKAASSYGKYFRK